MNVGEWCYLGGNVYSDRLFTIETGDVLRIVDVGKPVGCATAQDGLTFQCQVTMCLDLLP